MELADGFVEMSPEELADWINNRDVHDVNLTRISQAMDILAEASPVDKTNARFRAIQVRMLALKNSNTARD